MPYFESDAKALDWFERALTHDNEYVRREALQLLVEVDCKQRSEWLDRAQRDSNPAVAATAVVVAALAREGAAFETDLFESDLAGGLEPSDLQWEWEYAVVVCDDMIVPAGRTLAWTREEDDSAARGMALLKRYVGKEEQVTRATPIIVSKRLVTRFTRSPRSFSEAVTWHHRGRPRYDGG